MAKGNRMKKLGFIGLLISFSLHAGTMGEPITPSNAWFGAIGTGYSWSQKAGIKRPDPTWFPAIQGYDADLGNQGFYSFAVGKQINSYVDVSLSYLNNGNFNYQKFQTQLGTPLPRIRYFTLENQTLLLNGFFHSPRSLYVLDLDFTPFIGAGIGAGYNKVKDFHTIVNVTAGGSAVGTTSAIGNIASQTKFAWQGSVGLNIHPRNSHLSLDMGYRYLNGGKFYGPRTLYSIEPGFQGFSRGSSLSGSLKANQLFVELKYTV